MWGRKTKNDKARIKNSVYICIYFLKKETGRYIFQGIEGYDIRKTFDGLPLLRDYIIRNIAVHDQV